MNALLGLLRKEMLHILRDRRTLAVLTLMPILQVVLFGFAIRTDIDHVKLVIVDPAPDQATLELRSRFEGAGLFDIVKVQPTTNGIEQMFQRAQANEAVVFEAGFADKMARGLPAGVLVITDATEPNIGSAVQNYATTVIQTYEQEQQTRNPGVHIIPEVRMRFNPTRESSNLFVPGLIAFVLTIVSALMTAISLTREKETGTMETLLASPLRPLQIIAGKVAPYLVIAFVSALVVLIEARLLFHVPIRGSLTLLLAETLLFILVSLSLGMLISARTNSQRVAMMGALIGTMLPTMLLSGFIFPVESMPLPLRIISNIVPARWFVFIVRSIMLKGTGLDYLWKETIILSGMAFLLLAASTRSFKTRLE